MSARGILVALEGIDGAGKSTLQRSLARRWRRRGIAVGVRREPSDPELGRMAQEASGRAPWTGAMLFTLDRMVERRGLRRSLDRHDVVLTDRSFYSTLAYQGSALPPKARARLAAIQRGATEVPTRVVLLDLPPGVAISRLEDRGGRRAPLERLNTLSRVSKEYLRLARAPRWLVIDAVLPPDTLAEEVDRRLTRAVESARARRRRSA